jgi:hypothetical protein
VSQDHLDQSVATPQPQSERVPRILDLDLDFFLYGVAGSRVPEDGRLDEDEYPPWPAEEVIEFLEHHLGLDRRLPGVAVEDHVEVFTCWRDAIDAGMLRPPFDVVHVDAHADLGHGEPSWNYLLTELLHEELATRRHPRQDDWRYMTSGNYLTFAIACRWLASLTCVGHGSGRVGDVHQYVMEGRRLDADHIHLVPYPKDIGSKLLLAGCASPLASHEPRVPFAKIGYESFRADGPFDAIYLARSPEFTPAPADEIYDLITTRFIEGCDH